MQLKNKFILLWIAVLASLFYYSCKTSETIQNKGGENPTQQDLLQSKVDTNSAVLTPEILNRVTFLGHEMAKLYCNMKQYDGMDMTDIKVEKAYERLNADFLNYQKEVDVLNAAARMEYDRIFNEAKGKC